MAKGNGSAYTAREWHDWILSQRRTAFEVYKLEPKRLVSDSRRERQLTRDYEGREFLELLQNCADAAREASIPGRVLIELREDGLVIANTGAPFSTDGVLSLLISDASPKPGGPAGTIGSKGLGFRSLLNWSTRPLILSDAMRIAYGPEISVRLVAELCRESEGVRKTFERERIAGRGSLCPLLPFPDAVPSGDLKSVVPPNVRKLLAHCERVIDKGYMTVVGLPFDKPSHAESAALQIDGLTSEFLLFTDAIDEIAIVRQDGNATWRCERPSRSKRVLFNSSTEEDRSEWQLFSASGVVPRELLRDQTDPERYELKVAVPSRGFVPTAKTLFCYFPTNVSLPLGALCHATLELEHNRKHPQQIEANQYILSALAEYLAEVAESLAKQSKADYWRGLELLHLREPLAHELGEFGRRLFKVCGTKRILPTRDGQLADATTARSFDQADLLPSSQFPELVAARDDQDEKVMELIGVPSLSAKEFKARLSSVPFSPEERARLIVSFIQGYVGADFCTPALLIDSQGDAVAASESVFVPPEGALPEVGMPAWSPIKFLNGRLLELIAKGLGETNVRTLRRRMEDFGVQEYALGNLIQRLAAAANREIEATPASETRVRGELLATVAQLFAATDEERRPQFPNAVALKIRNQGGQWCPANTLYLGAPYGAPGTVMQALFKRHPQKLVAHPRDLALPPSTAAAFLQWVGVARWPREMRLEHGAHGFSSHVLSFIEYPAHFGDDYVVESVNYMPSQSVDQIRSLEDLDAILEAPSAAILAWLANDARADMWNTPGDHARLSVLPYRKQYRRYFKGALPCYISWRIRNAQWLPSTAAKRSKPSECMLGDRTLQDLFPQPTRPATGEMAQYALSNEGLHIALVRAGVPSNLGQFGTADIYGLLLDLPERKADGKIAKRLYSWLLENHTGEVDDTDENYLAFRRRGQMWGRSGTGEGYFPIAGLHHLEVEGLPEAVLSTLKVVDLPKRRGVEKIARLFGISTIDRSALQQSVEYHVSAPVATSAAERFQAAKPYFIVWRSSQAERQPQLELLRQLSLEVATKVTAAIRIPNANEVRYQLQPWTSAAAGTSLYVAIDPNEPCDTSWPLLANAVGNALAALLGLKNGSEFAQLFQCGDEVRKTLLGKLMGDVPESDLDHLLKSAGSVEKSESEIILIPSEPDGKGSKEAHPDSNGEPDNENGVKEPGANPWAVPETIEIEEVTKAPAPPTRHIELKVTNHGGNTGSRSGVQTWASGEAGELLAMKFERDKGRFPIRVGHITGYLAPGCDILSFDTAAKAKKFQTGPDRDSSAVARFIEVKARTGALIELKGNELTAARKWKARYYLYRIQAIDGGFALAVLRDPLACREALATVLELSIDQGASTQYFKIKSAEPSEI